MDNYSVAERVIMRDQGLMGMDNTPRFRGFSLTELAALRDALSVGTTDDDKPSDQLILCEHLMREVEDEQRRRES